ncbi:MAG: RNA polymerase sigma factor [Proteobacteria bacterium]|nr:RNA polymerase sigma factor [Pseudomonadota bacterium]
MDVRTGSLAVEPSERHVVDLEERAWLPRHCRGDRHAFPALLEAYRRPVYSYLARAGVLEAERDDVFQSVFLKIHAAARSYEPGRPLAPWIFTIVANTVRNHRRGKRNPGLFLSDHDGPEPSDPRPNPERAAEVRETIAWLDEAVAALPLAQREVLLLSGVVGMEQREIAEALDRPLNTVKTHLRRARLALAKVMARRDAPAERAGEPDETM